MPDECQPTTNQAADYADRLRNFLTAGVTDPFTPEAIRDDMKHSYDAQLLTNITATEFTDSKNRQDLRLDFVADGSNRAILTGASGHEFYWVLQGGRWRDVSWCRWAD